MLNSNQLLSLYNCIFLKSLSVFNLLSVSPTKWPITLKPFVNSRWIVWVCLIILRSWRLKSWHNIIRSYSISCTGLFLYPNLHLSAHVMYSKINIYLLMFEEIFKQIRERKHFFIHLYLNVVKNNLKINVSHTCDST